MAKRKGGPQVRGPVKQPAQKPVVQKAKPKKKGKR